MNKITIGEGNKIISGTWTDEVEWELLEKYNVDIKEEIRQALIDEYEEELLRSEGNSRETKDQFKEILIDKCNRDE